MVTEPSNYVVHPRVCVKWEEKGRATKKNGKEWQETDHGVRTATKRRRRKRRTVAKAAGAQVRAQTYPHGFPTRWPLEILGEPLHRAGSRETTSGLAELGEEWGWGGEGEVSSWNRPPLPAFLLCLPSYSSPPVLPVNTTGEQMAIVEIVKESHQVHAAIPYFTLLGRQPSGHD